MPKGYARAGNVSINISPLLPPSTVENVILTTLFQLFRFFEDPKMFGSTGFGGNSFMGSNVVTAPTNHNPMKDFEIMSPPDDSVSCLAFSPASIPQNFLIAGSWDNHVRCWEIDQTGKSIPKSQETMQGPVLDVAWSDASLPSNCFHFYL